MKRGHGMSAEELKELLSTRPHLAASNPELLKGLRPKAYWENAPAVATEVCVAGPLMECSCSRCTKKPKRKRQSAAEVFMSAYLDQKQREGYVLQWLFEGITLRIGDDCRYTPDFIVWEDDIQPPPPLFIEMKGARKWEDAIVKFKAAKTIFPRFRFEMWEYTKTEGLTKLL